MAILTPPIGEWSVSGLVNQATAAPANWWKVLPSPGWTFTALINAGKTRERVSLGNFSQEARQTLRFFDEKNALKPELLCNFDGRNWSLAIKVKNCYGLFNQYQAIAWLLVTYDQFLQEIDSQSLTGAGGWSYHEYEEVSTELQAENEKFIAAYTDLVNGLPSFLVSAPGRALSLVPADWSEAYLKMTQLFIDLEQRLTGKVENFRIEKARADLEAAKQKLQRDLELAQQANEVAEIEDQVKQANLQSEGANLMQTLSPEGQAREAAERESYLKFLADGTRFSYDNAEDRTSFYDIGRYVGISKKELEAAAVTPQSREAMMNRLNQAVPLVLDQVRAGSADWEKTPDGYVFLLPEEPDKYTSDAGESKFADLLKSKYAIPAAIAGGVLLLFMRRRK